MALCPVSTLSQIILLSEQCTASNQLFVRSAHQSYLRHRSYIKVWIRNVVVSQFFVSVNGHYFQQKFSQYGSCKTTTHKEYIRYRTRGKPGQAQCGHSLRNDNLIISRGEGGNAIYVPYGDVPPIRVYFLAFESETGCLFSSLTLKQGANIVRSLRARVPIHSTVWHPPIGFNLFVFCPGN